MKIWAADMEWSKYEGSIIKDTCTDWFYAETQEGVEEQADAKYGNNFDFKIISCY
jgi:hypothetical protein